ncbi:MAG: DUF2798 domain-containing protein [Pseudomonas sp.]
MLTHQARSTSNSWKLPKRFMPVVFAFYMSSFVALLVSCALVVMNSGIGEDLTIRVLNVYKFAMPVAFISVLSLRTTVLRLTAATLQP